MTEADVVKRRMIARILAVNDTNPDSAHRSAMRAIVMAAVNEGVDALTNHKAASRAGARQAKHKAQVAATDK